MSIVLVLDEPEVAEDVFDIQKAADAIVANAGNASSNPIPGNLAITDIGAVPVQTPSVE